jgi:hypothetical protein
LWSAEVQNPTLSVILYRMDQTFPAAGERLLYQMVSNRIGDFDEETVCCVRCYHTYVASDRIFECALRPDALRFELKPQPFQPLVDSELIARDKRPLTSTIRSANAAHRYLLNIVESPYQRPLWTTAAPPKPGSRTRPPPETVPTWAERLSHPVPLHWPRRRPWTRYSGYAIPPRVELPQPFPAPVTFSQSLAGRLYTGRPFDLTKIDPKRKLAMHANVEEQADRLTGFGA